jgi:hypothetical protein
MRSAYTFVLLLPLFGELRAQACDSRQAQAADSSVDLAPPPGFIEICSLDSQLCRVLTAGYPPSVRTLGYFADSADWNAFQKDSTVGFKHYLIAQLATTMRPEQLAGFKQYLRSQQGNIPDHSSLPSVLAAQGRVPLGIIAETPTSISFGTVMTATPVTTPSAHPMVLVATNTAAVLKNHMFSLYVFRDYRGDDDIDSTKATTQKWLQCLARAN